MKKGLFCDLSQTFDFVDHNILIRKLSGRIQMIYNKVTKFVGALVNMCILQGFILGPFLFLLYINDFPYFVEEKHGLVVFRNDTLL